MEKKSMIQITKFMDPDEFMWYNGEQISTLQWLEIERARIERKTGKRAYIQSKRGKKAIFREKMKERS